MARSDSVSFDFWFIFHSWGQQPSRRMVAYSGAGAEATEAGAESVFDVIVCSEGAIELSVG